MTIDLITGLSIYVFNAMLHDNFPINSHLSDPVESSRSFMQNT